MSLLRRRLKTRTSAPRDGAAAPFCAAVRAALDKRVAALAQGGFAITVTAGAPCPLQAALIVQESLALGAVLQGGGTSVVVLLDHGMVSVAATGPLCGAQAVGDGERPVSAVERHLCSAMLRDVALALGQAMAEVPGQAPLTLTLDRVEMQTRGLDILPLGAEVMPLTVAATPAGLAKGPVATLTILLPATCIVQVDTGGAGADRPDDAAWADHMRAVIAATSMPLDAVIDRFDMTAGQIARLQVGQVVPLAASRDAPVTLDISHQEGVSTLARGRLGKLKRQKGVRLAAAPSNPFLSPLRDRLSLS